MFRHSFVTPYVILLVVYFNFHCMHDYIAELHHKIYFNNLNIGIHWKK